MIQFNFSVISPAALSSQILSHASCPFSVTISFTYPAFFRQSVISLLRSAESSAISIVESLLSLLSILSMSFTLRPVSGLIDDTIDSKSSMTTSLSFIFITPVAVLPSLPWIVESGFIIFSHDTLCIPITSSTWNATFNLLKLVMINNPFSSVSGNPRHFLRSITVIIVSRGINIPSTLGCEFGTGVTGVYCKISLIFATFIP